MSDQTLDARIVDVNERFRDGMDERPGQVIQLRGPFFVDCRLCDYRMAEITPVYDRFGVLQGVTYLVDVRLVERPGRHPGTGLPRYGPAAREYLRHKGPRGAFDARGRGFGTMSEELTGRWGPETREIAGPFWAHCPECNAGQRVAVEGLEPPQR